MGKAARPAGSTSPQRCERAGRPTIEINLFQFVTTPSLKQMIWIAKRSEQDKPAPGTSSRDVSRETQFAVNRSIARASNVLARVKRKLVAPRVTKSRARLPSILINTMPKSGSIYLSRMVASSLGIEFSLKPLAHGFFPYQTPSSGLVEAMLCGKNISMAAH